MEPVEASKPGSEDVVVVRWFLLPPTDDIGAEIDKLKAALAKKHGWEETDLDDGLYQIQADSNGNGCRELLYVGKAQNFNTRLDDHAKGWLKWEWEPRIYIGYIWWVNGDADYYAEGDNPPDGKLNWEKYDELRLAVESLLIYSSQPVYNTSNKNTYKVRERPLRIINTGNYGLLPFETSAYGIEVGLKLGSRFKAAANAPKDE